MALTSSSSHADSIRRWLLGLWALVLIMAMVGAATRLTGSGLSIVEWRPVTGALPPLDERAWHAAFDAYKDSPQFREVNHWMSLEDFKRIFLWEYVHRLLGRVIGFACLLPWLYFLWKRAFDKRSAWRTFSLILLGGLQGVVGWFMVKSGLINEPRVSHLRLAMHLTLAFGIGQWILWQALDLRPVHREHASQGPTDTRDTRDTRDTQDTRLAWGLVALLALQIVYGAFVAGTKAGLLFATFPDMNGHYGPSAFWSSARGFENLVYNPLVIHYVHRALALLVSVYAVLVWVRASRVPRARTSAQLLLGALFLQVALGALTVITRVSMPWAIAHQAGAYLALSAAVQLCHAMHHVSEGSDDTEARARDGGLAGARQDLRSA
jgi:cytochrome c oxidase assembly protein subunit 15